MIKSEKYFTFIKEGFGYTFKMVKPYASGERHMTFNLRKVFDSYENQGYKYVTPFEYDRIYSEVFYFKNKDSEESFMEEMTRLREENKKLKIENEDLMKIYQDEIGCKEYRFNVYKEND